MPEITLISGMPSMHAVPMRRLAGYVNKHTNYRANLVMWVTTVLPAKSSFQEGNTCGFTPDIVEQLVRLAANSDVVGLSVYSFSEAMADQITVAVKQAYPEKIVIWGGLIPTVAPNHCVEKADFIVVGEGEVPLAQFLNTMEEGGDLHAIDGIWSKKNGEIISNPMVPLAMELDALGFPEYLIENSYVIRDGVLRHLPAEEEKRLVDHTMWAVVTQGCPHKCTYCAAAALTKVNSKYGALRRYSVDGLINYMKRTKEKLDLRAVYFIDDLFPEIPLRAIKKFSSKWQEEVRMPFHVMGLFPRAFNEEKFNYLMSAGLRRVRTGIQAGSERVRREVYKRRYTNDELIELSRKISRRSTSMSLSDYDFMLDLPWESDEEKIEGLRLLSRLEPPFTINCYHFMFMPSTELTEQAKAEGIFDSDFDRAVDENYDPVNNEPTYINLLYFLYMVVHIPPSILKYLISDRMLKRNIRIPRFVFRGILFLKDLRTVYYRVRDQDPTNMPWFLSPLVLRRFAEGRIGRSSHGNTGDADQTRADIKESAGSRL